MHINEPNRSGCLFKHPCKDTRSKCLIWEIRKDTVGKCRIIFDLYVECVCLCACKLTRIREHLVRDFDERGGIVRAADRKPLACEEVEIRARTAANIVDTLPRSQTKQLLDACALCKERGERNAALHDIKTVDAFQFEKYFPPIP